MLLPMPVPLAQLILQDLVNRSQAIGAAVVLSTLSVHGELITGKQEFDQPTDVYSQLIEKVAVATNTALAPMRARIVEYEHDFNVYPAGVGIVDGVLTVDGVHPCQVPPVR